ncbi:flagellar hook-associated protein 2 [Desulfopila sp. IMCC35006]|uniref:flagellar filament capping protein FliD n=1 Tax=Desulfopila sp. IMCC35006 TaxID=2569542 RepID=UPI0010AD4964|nr:flagellar filament capping protein FliD [Desulfopila sp. IMCC35006]TKB25830.1 flagellar hook-associated protein 2 [Desulfopila sp. IMCC35006]
MSITFSGLATGLDTDTIVTDLMAVERAPIDRLTAKKTSETQRLKAYAQFKAKLDNLKTAVADMSITSQVRTTSVSLSSEDAFTATTTSGAVGSYKVSVVQLSQVQKTVTRGFSSNSESVLGTGTISVNGTDIAVTEDNNSLLGLVSSINKLSGTTGVQASIINDGTDDSPYHLVFTGKDAKTNFTIDESKLGLTTAGDLDFEINDVQSAQQAVAIIDGITVVSDTNTITGAINGVTLNLNSVNAAISSGSQIEGEEDVDPWNWQTPPVYETTKMDIKSDTGALKEKVTTFVTAYNEAMEWILSGYDEFGGSSAIPDSTDGSTADTELGAVLRGDATINSMKRQLQGVLTNSVKNSGKFHILSEIGISTNLNGTLKQDNTKLDAALQDNFDDMVSLLSGDDETAGVMKNFNSLLLNLTSSSKGMYAVKKTAYDSAVKSFDSQLNQMELRMTKREAILRSQFTAMESLISSLNAQGDFLTQQMNALNGTSNS